jgi:NAD(P)-dependent dehydrogenase (short-subunit alcohol dehydrogenase family)
MMSKTAIVTAASSGMGKAIAERLNMDGYNLVIMSSTDRIKPVAEALEVNYLTGSVTRHDDLEKLVRLAMDSFGSIDVVVNNTGHPAKGDLLEIGDEDWHAGLDIILMNVIRMSRLVTPIMQQSRGGSIINISTFAAFEPSLKFPVSSAMRAALGSYCKLFADRFGKDNIRMNNVLPGYIDSYPIDDDLAAEIPLKRSGTVEEIANTVSFLASEQSGYITGQNIKVDGGLGRAV